jgi:uncharacterized protein
LQKHQASSNPGLAEAQALPAVAIFARNAIPGKTKTRLIPALGAEGAAEFHGALVSDTLRKVSRLKGKIVRYLFVADGAVPASLLPRGFRFQRQRGRDLGERLDRAFSLLLRGHSRALILGTDSPAIPPATFRLALQELRLVDAVLGPCPDGGYYLIGLRRNVPGLFHGVRLGSEHAFQDTLGSLIARRISCAVLESCPDIDRPEDLLALEESLLKKPRARRLLPATWKYLSLTASKRNPAAHTLKK